MDCLRTHFNSDESDNHEFSIEVDPRTIDTERIQELREQGFNRLSFGVQDFDEKVQRAVNRLQSEQQVFDLVAARSEEHTSELQSRPHLVCRLLLEKKKKKNNAKTYILH